ncbi:MAG: group II intron reverse transcriptase domain-containing protein, partial [Parcubacteria group bacterium]|nr:group II intron reverse transcriptase domain-containing protein [Parcubacteria group bacterium]
IHKASVRDRLLHHAIYRILYPFFDRIFIADSYSCRVNKGTHRALDRFRSFGYQASLNNTRACWVLKCDIKKFFANIDHDVLKNILERYVPDQNILRLLRDVVGSFYSSSPGVGLPLGNLTSQLFVNVYMNEFDQFVKHKLKAKYYIRYADDFIILSGDRNWLGSQIGLIRGFLRESLKLEIHEHKIFVKTLSSGVDWLGWVHFLDHRVLRAAARRRMVRRIGGYPTQEIIDSYVGLLGHGNARKLQSTILDGNLVF